MTANQTDYSIQQMSRILGVSHSGFYAHQSRLPCTRSIADDAIAMSEPIAPLVQAMDANAVAESFFNLLKRERIRRRKYKTRDDARRDGNPPRN